MKLHHEKNELQILQNQIQEKYVNLKKKYNHSCLLLEERKTEVDLLVNEVDFIIIQFLF